MKEFNLDESLQKIGSKSDFSEFVMDILDDYKENASNWENTDLESFLEAMAAWSKDMDGYYINLGRDVPQDVPWKIFAEIIYAARIYE
ncbi:hypothetical protein ACCI51_13695 [Microbulbifer echini]|uniref:DUF7660 domain-containing protein n=1 Tax=Microbulbifer echini TaxID=1529067 RepID=A0ABV4NPY1_9GAMM|nr:hypothetical protein [uncultured Microbulbifer sp.]